MPEQLTEDKQLILGKKEKKDDECGEIAEGNKFGIVESLSKEVVLDKMEEEEVVEEKKDNEDDGKSSETVEKKEDDDKSDKEWHEGNENVNYNEKSVKIIEKNRERDEESEREIREEYELLKKEVGEFEKKWFEPYAISTLNWTEEFIKEFGAEKFADAIEEIKKSNKPKNMHEVVKILEPDKGERQELYAKIINKDEVSFESSKDIELRKDIKLRIEKIEFLKHLDNLGGFPKKVLLKIEQILGGESSISGEIHFGLFSFGDIGTDFKERLIKYNGDIEKLAIDSRRDNLKEGMELRTKQQELVNELHREIEQINIRLKTKYLKENEDLLKKLEKANTINKPIIKGGKEITDAEISSIEKILEENYKSVEKEIDELTKERRELIEEIEKIHI